MSAAQEIRAIASKRAWRRAVDHVDEIHARRNAPEMPLTLGGQELVRLRGGEIAVLVAGAKRAKTSLAICAAIEHARDRGPAIFASLELRGRTLVERAIGTRCDASWRQVQRGEVSFERMRDVLPDRFTVIDRDEAAIEALDASVADLRSEHPGEPILVVIDYVQLVASAERDVRMRVDDAMRKLDRLAVANVVGMLALSQSGRAASRDLARGEKYGLEAADAGAESASIERWASAVISIGKIDVPEEDGSETAELSIAAARYEAGDRIVPARVNRRTGRWLIAGDARPASEVRAERVGAQSTKKRETLKRSIVDLLAKAPKPMSKAEIARATTGQNGAILDAIKELIREGAICHDTRVSQGGHSPLWTPANITADAKHEI